MNIAYHWSKVLNGLCARCKCQPGRTAYEGLMRQATRTAFVQRIEAEQLLGDTHAKYIPMIEDLIKREGECPTTSHH